MLAPRRTAALMLALLAIPLSAAEPTAFVAAPSKKVATPFVEGAWVLDSSLVLARLTALDDAERLAFIRERTGLGIDPFATPPDRPKGFLTWRLEIHNKSSERIIFQPQSIVLVTKSKFPLRPLDIPEIESAFGRLDQEVPPAYRHVRKAIFDGEVILAPGQRASGLLVFRMVPPRTQSFTIDIAVTHASGEASRLAAAYRRAKG